LPPRQRFRISDGLHDLHVHPDRSLGADADQTLVDAVAQVELETTGVQQPWLALHISLEGQRTRLSLERQPEHVAQGMVCRKEAAAVVAEPKAIGALVLVGAEDRSLKIVAILIEIDSPEFDIPRQMMGNGFDAADGHAQASLGPREWRERKYSTQLQRDWPVLRRTCDRTTL
jgi:hypothetical protein